MSVVAGELIAYSSGVWTANPDDSATVNSTSYANILTDISTPLTGGVFGGAIDLTTRVIFAQLAATDTVQVLSDGADGRTCRIVGRLASGLLAAEQLTLNGVTAVTSANTYERIESVTLASASATRIFTLRRTTGATLIVNVGGPAPADATEIRATAMFRNSTIPVSGTTDRYEKFFWKNSNASAFALTSVIVSQAADPQGGTGRITHALAVSVDETNAIANRITVPGAGILAAGAAGTFDDTAKSVPGGSIAAASRIGVWLKESLPSTDSPFKNSYTSQLDGNTT